MKRQLKLFLGIFVLCICVIPFVEVKAEDYTADILASLASEGDSVELEAGDTVTIGGTQYIGEGTEAYFNITQGTVKLTNKGNYLEMVVTKDSIMESNHSKNLMYFSYNTQVTPIYLTVDEGAIFNLNGGMALTSGNPVTFTNNGTVNIYGYLEVRSGSTYTGSGTTNLYETLAIYSTEATFNTYVNVFEDANVYSNNDVFSYLVIGEQDTDTYTYAIGENTKSYTSVSGDAVSSDFAYGYTLIKTEVSSSETTTTEDTTDEETNPKTADSILLVTLTLLVSAGVSVFVGRKLAKQKI